MRSVRLRPERILPPAAVFATGFIYPGFGPGFALPDPMILAMIVLWLPLLVYHGYPRRVLGSVTLPLVLILLGSAIGSLTVGLERWIVLDLMRDVGAFASFLAMVTMLQRGGPRAVRAVAIAAAVGTLAVSGLQLLDQSLRASVGFPNPNVAGHFLATNLIVLTMSPAPRWLRSGAAVLCVVALVGVGSFGALLMLVGGLAYLTSTSGLVVRSAAARRVVPFALLGVFAVVMTNLPATTSTTGFNAKHFERASGGRTEMWTETLGVAIAHPAGIGPGSNRGLGLLPGQQEAHSEYLAYLTERGVLGLVGLLLLYLALWRLGRPGGLARALVIAFAIQSVVRETLHYRHLWLLLAFALVLENQLGSDDPEHEQHHRPPVRLREQT